MDMISKDTLCIMCKKTASVAVCYGCQQPFCTKHFLRHRSHLADQMDDLQKKYEHFRQDVHRDRFEQPLLSAIYAWEKKSMRKIQEIAEKARDDLQRWLERTKAKIHSSLEHITKKFAAVEKSNNFTETDVHRWTKQLEELRNLLEKPSTVSIVQERKCTSAIHGIKLVEKPTEIPNVIDPLVPNNIERTNERFVSIFGPCNLSDENRLVTHSSYRAGFSQITGENEYSSGKHSISFLIEKKGAKNMFFGIYSSAKQSAATFDSSVHGWWNLDHMIVNGESTGGNDTETIQTGDQITLIIDCDHRQIDFEHHRTKKCIHLSINLDVCAFPWKILVRLLTTGDSLRIL